MNKNVTPLIILLLVASSLITVKPVWASSATENSWVAKAPMPNGLSIVKAAVANGKIYVMNSSSNYEYDPAIDTWTAKKPMPTPRLWLSFGIAACENKIFVIGGNNGENGYTNYLSTNEVYDPSTDTWETKTPMPTSREWVEANVVDGKIYVISGVTDNYSSIRTHVNEVYDPATDSWTEKQPVPFAVIKGASAVVDNKSYLIGGLFNSSSSFNAISNQIYDTDTDTWSLASLPNPMWYTAAGATRG